MTCSRRRLLISTLPVAAAFAGCSSSSNSNNSGDDDVVQAAVNQNTERPDVDNDGVPDITDDYPNDSSRSTLLDRISDRRNIEEDHWRVYSFQLPQTGFIEYEFTVRDGEEIDVILFDESEYQFFEEGERWRYHSDLSVLNRVGGRASGRISAGDYRLVFDNSNEGEARPPTNFSNDVVSVEFTIEISV